MDDIARTSDGFLGTEPDDFWRKDRLPRGGPRSARRRWFQTDSEQTYQRRGNKRFPPESVNYEFNSHGYRGPEFQRVAGEAAPLFIGDSNTFGLGTPWEKLWTTLVTAGLEEHWKVPARQLNLGWGGTGSDYVAMIVHQTAETLCPDAVFVLWSFFERLSWFPEPDQVVHFMPEGGVMYTASGTRLEFARADHRAYLRLANSAHGFYNFVRNFHFVNERLLRLGIPFYWGTLEQVPAETLQRYVSMDGYVGAWKHDPADLARDSLHSGPSTHAAFADTVMSAITRDHIKPRSPLDAA